MTDRLYHFHFVDLATPITILAPNRDSAFAILSSNPLPADYAGKEIESETTSMPLIGITTMKDGKKTLVWAGRSPSYPDGWKEK